MDELVGDVVEGILSATRPDVTVLVTVALQAPIDTRQQAEASEVKLALVHQQRIVNILLYNKRSVSIFTHRSAYDRLDLADGLHHGNALASVSVLTRLDDPGVLRRPVLFADTFDRLLII